MALTANDIEEQEIGLIGLSPELKTKVERQLSNLDNLSIELNVQNVLPGYPSFLDFKQNFQMLRLEDIYQKFHEAAAVKEENNSVNKFCE